MAMKKKPVAKKQAAKKKPMPKLTKKEIASARTAVKNMVSKKKSRTELELAEDELMLAQVLEDAAAEDYTAADRRLHDAMDKKAQAQDKVNRLQPKPEEPLIPEGHDRFTDQCPDCEAWRKWFTEDRAAKNAAFKEKYG